MSRRFRVRRDTRVSSSIRRNGLRLDYAGKRVVVIGSGATAITIVPSMAEKAAHVTMLQRSPTYVMSLGRAQAFANFVSRHLPAKLAYRVMRAYSVPFQMWFYNKARKKPQEVKEFILGEAREKLPAGYDLETLHAPLQSLGRAPLLHG